MQKTLKNAELAITVDTFGAELQSIKHDEIEYLWHADPEFWARHAPVLFPIVGRLKNGQYQYDGETYKLSGHGFARDSEFELVAESSNELTYELKDSEQTLENYPFHFALRITYKLEKNKLHVAYEVENRDDKEIFFGIGAHPAFNVPIEKGNYENYQLTIEPQSKRNFIPFNVENETLNVADMMMVADYKKPLTRELFKNDALVYKSTGKTAIKLSNNLDERSVTISWANMPYFGLWSPYPKEAPFVCIEPWAGLADDDRTDGDFTKKFAINKLPVAEKFNCSFDIEIN